MNNILKTHTFTWATFKCDLTSQS